MPRSFASQSGDTLAATAVEAMRTFGSTGAAAVLPPVDAPTGAAGDPLAAGTLAAPGRALSPGAAVGEHPTSPSARTRASSPPAPRGHPGLLVIAPPPSSPTAAIGASRSPVGPPAHSARRPRRVTVGERCLAAGVGLARL